MKIILDLTDDEIELLKSQLDNNDKGPRGESWKSSELEGLIDKVDEALQYSPDGKTLRGIVFNGENGEIIQNNTSIKKVVKIGIGHYKFE